MAIASIKGIVAGAVNIGVAAVMGAAMPPMSVIAAAATVGLIGYGVSLTLFVLALRDLGTARTGAYFSVAPFFGAAIALVVQHEPISAPLMLAAGLMAWGVWLLLSEVQSICICTSAWSTRIRTFTTPTTSIAMNPIGMAPNRTLTCTSTRRSDTRIRTIRISITGTSIEQRGPCAAHDRPFRVERRSAPLDVLCR